MKAVAAECNSSRIINNDFGVSSSDEGSWRGCSWLDDEPDWEGVTVVVDEELSGFISVRRMRPCH